MTKISRNGIISLNTEKIEVACFKSTPPDAAGADEGEGKGRTPKEETSCGSILGHRVKNFMTVIRQRMGRYQGMYIYGYHQPAPWVPAFLRAEPCFSGKHIRIGNFPIGLRHLKWGSLASGRPDAGLEMDIIRMEEKKWQFLRERAWRLSRR